MTIEERRPCNLIGHFCVEPTHWPKGAHRHMVGGIACRPGEKPAEQAYSGDRDED